MPDDKAVTPSPTVPASAVRVASAATAPKAGRFRRSVVRHDSRSAALSAAAPTSGRDYTRPGFCLRTHVPACGPADVRPIGRATRPARAQTGSRGGGGEKAGDRAGAGAGV